MLRVMLDGDGTATADNVRAAVELPAGMDPRCLGSVPGRLAYDHVIRAAGFVRSTRPVRHASWLQVWELRDRAAAECWLRDYPDLPDPADDDADEPTVQTSLFDTQEIATPTGPPPAMLCKGVQFNDSKISV